jgi:hypothetical protein
MSNAHHVRASDSVARRAGATKARRGRPRKEHAKGNAKNHVTKNHVQEDVRPKPSPDEAEDERVIRAKGLLAATLRVWELKHRISD